MQFQSANPVSSILGRGRARRIAAVLAVVAAAPMLVQCDFYRPKQDTPPPVEAPETPPAPKVIATPTPPALGRADMIAAASRAASDYASGAVAPGTDPLVGRAFSVRTPFGCGPMVEAATLVDAPAGLARAGWGPDRKTIQLTLAPGDWTASSLIAAPGAEAGWEAVEGFWLARPWLASEACPAVMRDPLQGGGAPGAGGNTVGLAAVFKEGASRVARRNGRAYVFTVRPEGDATSVIPPAEGYRVLIEGRVGSFPGGRAFRCRAAGPDQRPVCVAAMSLDRVAFTLADGTVLSEWRPG